MKAPYLSMKKVLLLIAIIAVSSLSVAQDKLWLGDYRVGITGGCGYVLQAPKYNLGSQMQLRESSRKLTPTVGLYLGMQKDIHGRWAWGIDENISAGKSGWMCKFTNTKYSLNLDYDVQQLMLSERLGAHLAYFTGLHTQLQAGAALYWEMYMSQNIDVIATNATSAAYNIYGPIKAPESLSVSYNAGLDLSLGATYYLSNSWFFRGDAHYFLPLMHSKEYFVPGFDFDNEIADMVTSLGDSRMMQVAAYFTIGFLW